jgi:hypothetical protein
MVYHRNSGLIMSTFYSLALLLLLSARGRPPCSFASLAVGGPSQKKLQRYTYLRMPLSIVLLLEDENVARQKQPAKGDEATPLLLANG